MSFFVILFKGRQLFDFLLNCLNAKIFLKWSEFFPLGVDPIVKGGKTKIVMKFFNLMTQCIHKVNIANLSCVIQKTCLKICLFFGEEDHLP